jgi:hypothetical protein
MHRSIGRDASNLGRWVAPAIVRTDEPTPRETRPAGRKPVEGAYFFLLGAAVAFGGGTLVASPITVLSGQIDTMGHLLQLAAMAMGQSVMAFRWAGEGA